jgi:hypothetical protein
MRWRSVLSARSLVGAYAAGLYKPNPVVTHSLKAA